MLDWWLSEVPIAFSEGNVLQVQAAVDKYNALISSQSRDLERLGIIEIAQVPSPTECNKDVIAIYVHDDSIEGSD